MQHNDPHSACAFSILNNALEYGPLNNFMSLIKQVKKGPLKNSFEQFCIKSHYYRKKLVSEQNKRQRKPMHQLYLTFNGFGGLEVACWPLVIKFAGSNPAEAVGFLRVNKNPQHVGGHG